MNMTQTLTYKLPEHLVARRSAERHEWTVQIIGIAVAVVTLAAAGFLVGPVNEIRKPQLLEWWHAEIEGKGRSPKTGRNYLDALLQVVEKDRNTRNSRAEQLLKELGKEGLSGRLSANLSGGERRRLEIARALVAKPKILFLDEPFTGIDPIAVGDVKDLVVGLVKRDISVLITDHNVRDTLSITDRAYILEGGRILANGTPEELVDNEVVREAYLGEGVESSLSEEIDRWRKRRNSATSAEEKTVREGSQ